MVALITSILTIVSIILEGMVRYRQSAEKKEEDRNVAIERGREAIADGDVALVNARVDRLSSGSPAGDPQGQRGDEDTAERLRKVLDS